jgi:predicted branched-subunit amino acid permease
VTDEVSETGRVHSKGSLFLLTAAVVLFGIAYGADSAAAGNGILLPTLTSLFVQGGASQIASEGVLRSGGGALAAIVVGMALNLRFMALALVIAPDLPTRKIVRLVAIYLISDIPVGLAIATPDRRARPRVFLEVGILAASAWIGGTLIGTIVGSAFDVSILGADGAIAAAFVALAIGNIKGVRTTVVAVVSFGVTAGLLAVTEAGIAVLGGAIVALVVERLTRARDDEEQVVAP